MKQITTKEKPTIFSKILPTMYKAKEIRRMVKIMHTHEIVLALKTCISKWLRQ